MKHFPDSTAKQLGFYVYLYLDPRDESIFYVGKGKGNRAFSHLELEDDSPMATRIAAIREAGHEPGIEILAHGFADAETALRVEAAAIDLLGRDNLENRVHGFGSREFGRYAVEEIAALYCETPVKIPTQEAVLLIRINQHYYSGMPSQELYEVTRGVWKLALERAQNVRYVFAIFDNVVREVYEPEAWFQGGKTAYFHRMQEEVDNVSRLEFIGRIAPQEVRKKYVLKSVSNYFAQGAANPVQYVNC